MEPEYGQGKILEIEGDLFDAPDGAALIRYPNAFLAYRSHCQKYMSSKQEVVVRSDTGPRKIQLPEGTALIIPPQPEDYEPSGGRQHWIVCLFTSCKYGRAVAPSPILLENTELAIADLKDKIDKLRGEGINLGRLWSCRFNSGLFGVDWARSRDLLVRSGLEVTVVRPPDARLAPTQTGTYIKKEAVLANSLDKNSACNCEAVFAVVSSQSQSKASSSTTTTTTTTTTSKRKAPSKPRQTTTTSKARSNTSTSTKSLLPPPPAASDDDDDDEASIRSSSTSANANSSKRRQRPSSRSRSNSITSASSTSSRTSHPSNRTPDAEPEPEPDYILAEITHHPEEAEDITTREPVIPPKLLTRLLHHHFQHPKTKIAKDANTVVAKYVDVFVREALARAAFERREAVGEGAAVGDGFLEVEDLEKLAPQLVMDF
ncbi:uncharacterized protein BP01DRAFT_370854 [Aspergillus saccharolyticus JOP 1030-1]|uniref:ADP-ribose 1''-phosphate phosphatase n=1 Tax=Aspergillus saccharolyticus JOP 1030-1 TaxID=1450539 RepID=A0A318ZP45_9EURO|nr:hypothetical protein BP01DRAFT_370854 [Aspergillus saccharolyticus JOP 1030-1]PYH49391.1 hypothetical protein BP01DRAFT_370854 [Aspergillus saccharolyticus JOP 1030-1]